MKRAPFIVRLFAAVVAVSLFAVIGYLANRLTSSATLTSERVVDATDAATSKHGSHGIEPARENALMLASIPWTRSSNAPAPSVLAPAAQPFVQRSGTPAAIPLAHLPSIRARNDLARPTPVVVGSAQMPWGRLQTPEQIAATAPLAVPAADLPPIRVRHNPLRPTRAELKAADVPWNRRKLTTEVKYLEPASVPRLAAKRDPAKPVPSRVPTASLPWDRDTQDLRPTHVETARVPSALKAAKPK